MRSVRRESTRGESPSQYSSLSATAGVLSARGPIGAFGRFDDHNESLYDLVAFRDMFVEAAQHTFKRSVVAHLLIVGISA